MDDPDLIARLEDVLARRERGEAVDLAAHRDPLGPRWERFRELLAFEGAFAEALESDGGPGVQESVGPYDLLRVLGRGAFGVVYEAHDRKLDRPVALKMLRPELEADGSFRSRYDREARSCARVRHPNLIEIYDYGEVDGRLYYAMPLLAGGTLAEVLQQEHAPAPDELCRRMADIADAVGALHAAQIVHRDIKPANIVIEEDGRFVLADFGLARRIDLPALTQQGQRPGTPQFMSPEQLAGRAEDIGPATDVYALGATLYQAISGRYPFEAAEVQVLYRQVLTQRPLPLEQVSPRATTAVSRVVMRCLERRPADRYASAHDLAADLRAAAAGETVRAPARRGLRTLRERVRGSHLALAVLVIGAVVAALALAPGREPPPVSRRGIVIVTAEDGSLPPELRDYARELERSGVPVEIRVPRLVATRDTVRRAPLQLVYPRGPVRPADLDTVRVDVTEAFEGRGRLVFRRGGEEVASVPFEPKGFRNLLPVPPAVRQAAREGEAFTWSWEPERGAPVTGAFEVVEPNLDEALARVDAVAAEPGRGPEVRLILRSLVLLEHDLGVAAFRTLEGLRAPSTASSSTATPLAGDGLSEGDLAALLRLQAEALRMAYGEDVVSRDAADVWNGVLVQLDDLRVQSDGPAAGR